MKKFNENNIVKKQTTRIFDLNFSKFDITFLNFNKLNSTFVLKFTKI